MAQCQPPLSRVSPRHRDMRPDLHHAEIVTGARSCEAVTVASERLGMGNAGRYILLLDGAPHLSIIDTPGASQAHFVSVSLFPVINDHEGVSGL